MLRILHPTRLDWDFVIGSPEYRQYESILISGRTHLSRRLAVHQPVLLKRPIGRGVLLEVLERIRWTADGVSHDECLSMLWRSSRQQKPGSCIYIDRKTLSKMRQTRRQKERNRSQRWRSNAILQYLNRGLQLSAGEIDKIINVIVA